MTILLTGASSFSGFWFARELARRGHNVVATFRGNGEGDYDGIRRRRVSMLAGVCNRVFGCVFGGAEFLRLINDTPGVDVFCCHSAAVGDFRASSFDVVSALRENTCNLPDVFAALHKGGCRNVVLTGSVFESGEGKGTDGLPAILPYGLAKSLTWQSFVFYARQCGINLGKFVIANPFGPFEEARFTAYLARQWRAGKSAMVRTPDYVRDNIHISLLALQYAGFVEAFASGSAAAILRPSGYVETQGDFARRFADAMQTRWKMPCALEFAAQTEFVEPMVRVNTDVADVATLQWDEKAAWDAIADYYQND